MVLTKVQSDIHSAFKSQLTPSKKRRIRRKRLLAARACNTKPQDTSNFKANTHIFNVSIADVPKIVEKYPLPIVEQIGNELQKKIIQLSGNTININMSSKETAKSREEILAAREAKKQAKQKAKKGEIAQNEIKQTKPANDTAKCDKKNEDPKQNSDSGPNVKVINTEVQPPKITNCLIKSKDEVDHLINHNVLTNVVKLRKDSTSKQESDEDRSKEQIRAERAAKKAIKQAKKKGALEHADKNEIKEESICSLKGERPVDNDMTMKDVVETLKDIVNVAKEVKDVTAKVQAINLEPKKQEEAGKSKAELKAERRAKQEAQRAAKQAAADQKTVKPKETSSKPAKPETEIVKQTVEKPKQKASEKTKPKVQYVQRINWFQHLSNEHDKEALKKIAINSNLHPAIVKLGVQLASRVVTGSNARCVALLDALRKMVTDYTLPAKTEFARGLEAHLTSSLDYLWSMRQPSATQTNAVKYFRHRLTQLPNNVNEHEAKKNLRELIDNYVREQIDKAGEAISLAVRKKICNGDNILTYGCSSLVERILVEAWEAGVRFRVVVVGDRLLAAARDLLRRLCAKNLPCTYIDITAVSYLMKTVDKVVLGASSLLADGSVVGPAGAAQVALAARARNVPVLAAAETHKFSARVQTDAFVYNELGDPDDLIDKSDPNSPLKEWRSNPNLTPLNLLYDVTPPSLVTAVVTELAILPCTSAPVVLRTKLAEHGL